MGVNFFFGLRFLGFLYSNASLHLAYSNLLTILTVLFLPAFLVPGNFSSNIQRQDMSSFEFQDRLLPMTLTL